MGLEQEQYKKEKMRVESLNEQIEVNAENLGLGYLDMNSRMLHMEEQSMTDKRKWGELQEEHKKRKEKIEDFWHSSTADAIKTLEGKIPLDSKGKAISSKNPEHYKNFSLKELEILIKNNEYGRNSQEYNDVATDLELLNALEGKVEEGERLELLGRLSESCNKYLTTRSNPITPKGKRRRAMIEQLYSKIQQEELAVKEQTAAAYQTIDQAEDLLQVPQETVEQAIRGKFHLLSNDLKKSLKEIDLEDREQMRVRQTEQDKQEDIELTKIAKALSLQEVFPGQSCTLSTRFLNAIGWTKRTPKKAFLFERELEKSPVKVKLYHTIAAPAQKKGEKKTDEKKTDASEMVNQLIGNIEDSRQYLSYGNYGKGTYTVARGDKYQDVDYKIGKRMDQDASKHSWEFGMTQGSMQVTMTFNQNAKIIDVFDAKVLLSHFEKKYPEFYNYLNRNEDKASYTSSQMPAFTSIILAFYGYNTLFVPGGAKSSVITEDGKRASMDYYITFDRSAFTVDAGGLAIRGKDDIEDY